MEQHSEPDQQQRNQADAPERVCATEPARAFINELRSRHGPLMFFQSGGCCDGSAPMCYPLDEFSVSDTDVLLGAIDGTPFYIGCEQFGYWAHTQLIIDVVPGNGGMFSLDNGTGKRFLTRSRLFRDDERARLQAAVQAPPVEPASVQAPPSGPASAQAPPS